MSSFSPSTVSSPTRRMADKSTSSLRCVIWFFGSACLTRRYRPSADRIPLQIHDRPVFVVKFAVFSCGVAVAGDEMIEKLQMRGDVTIDIHRHEASQLQKARINLRPAQDTRRNVQMQLLLNHALPRSCARRLTLVGLCRVSMGPPMSVIESGTCGLSCASIRAIAAISGTDGWQTPSVWTPRPHNPCSESRRWKLRNRCNHRGRSGRPKAEPFWHRPNP